MPLIEARVIEVGAGGGNAPHYKNQGGQLKLLKLTKKIKDLLMITKLLTVFEIYEDEESAIASFK